MLPLIRSASRNPALQVGPLEQGERDEWLQFIDETGRLRLFFPRYTAADFFGGTPGLRGIDPRNFWLCRRNGQIAGTLAAWDQSSFKQTVVERYHGPLRFWRPMHNLVAPAIGWPRFPAPGARLPHAMLAVPLLREDDPEVFWAMCAAASRTLRGNVECLLLGLFERDPLVPAVRRRALHCYMSRVYVACWDDAAIDPRQFENRNLYLELGSL
jgi:hypothetical protein